MVTRSVYKVTDLLAYVGGFFSSIKGLIAIVAMIILNNSAEIATWNKMRRKKDDDIDPQDKTVSSAKDEDGPLSCCFRLKMSLNTFGVGFICCCMSKKSKQQEASF